MSLEAFQQELLEYLRRKGGPIGLARIQADHRHRPEPEILANLAVLRRAGLAQTLRPGEWEAAPEAVPGHEPVPPAPAGTGQPVLTTAAAARAVSEERRRHEREPRQQPAAVSEHEEADMASETKVCNECNKRKPQSDFYGKCAKCKPCYNAARRG